MAATAAKEFSLALSRPMVGAGDVRVELRNVGEDPHTLVVSPEGIQAPLASFSTVGPGLYERRTVALSPGRALARPRSRPAATSSGALLNEHVGVTTPVASIAVLASVVATQRTRVTRSSRPPLVTSPP